MSKFHLLVPEKTENKVSTKIKAVCVSIGAGIAGAVAAVTPSFAAIDLTGVTIDTSDYVAIATLLITALVAFWGIKKGLSLFGR